ncbi:VCBS domain-containing protein [Saccharophagus degradans]|uniref:VCBS domain-containing protein n=1 Tax=Saccharophagus degradans TaxID=86304 RepID=A0AAW7X6T0_9GAMM|nr:VCBS domain-containing protein [Saccharophagus degradans]MDO6422446.1 VCBS domain-containing protein [Saccharophagus degradans]MDO6608014.1 VCBS domain-containing protein [Saccharophagus degradans]
MKMKTQALALSALCMAMVGCGGSSSSDNGGEADIRFPFDGEITLSGDTDPGATLTAVVTDANGISGSISYVWTSGDTVITSATGSTYVIADSDQGNSISVTATYTDDDNFDESVFASVTIEAAATPATFEGLAATIGNAATEALTGTVVVTDPNTDEESIVALTDAMTTYGTFSITAEGNWTYTLDTTADAVANLTSSDDPLLDSVDIESADGTTASLVITITGAEVVAPTTTKAAKITNTTVGDSGELRYAIGSAMTQGKLTVSFLKDDNAIGVEPGEPDSPKDAYISLFGDSVTNSKAIADLRIQSDKFAIRDQDEIDVGVAFTPGEWHDVEITWDASAASDTVGPAVTITIDGTLVGSFTSKPTGLANIKNGVEFVVFKFGDNDSTIADAAFYVDNVKLYSDTAGTTEVFSDDFESYDEDATLVVAPYHTGNSLEAIVAVINGPASGETGGGSGGDSGNGSGPGNAGNKIAKIINTTAGDSGELRYPTGSPMVQGKLTVSFLKDDNAIGVETGEPDSPKDAYISLFGDSVTNSKAIADLRIQSDKFAIRDQDEIDVTTAFTPGEWQDVEITWDASAASDTVGPTVTITIDGESVATFTSKPTGLANIKNGVEYIVFKFGDNDSTIADAAFHVDNVKVYSDTAGTVEVFSDDFESYSVDAPLAVAPYHTGNTFEAFVAVED